MKLGIFLSPRAHFGRELGIFSSLRDFIQGENYMRRLALRSSKSQRLYSGWSSEFDMFHPPVCTEHKIQNFEHQPPPWWCHIQENGPLSPRVKLDFANPPPPPSMGLEFSSLYRFWDMKKYVENMEKNKIKTEGRGRAKRKFPSKSRQ